VTPIVATVLIVIAMAAVAVHTLRHSDSATKDTGFGSTTTIAGTPGPLTSSSTTTPPPTTTTTNPDNPELAIQAVKAVDALQGEDGVQYGVAVYDRTTGKLTTGTLGASGFYSASVVKLFVVVALLYRQESGSVTLDSNDRYDITRALELSDDNAMDAMWERHDGPALVDEMIKLAGLHDTVLDKQNTGEWGETKISARDVLAVWDFALTKLSATDRNTVIDDTHHAANNGSDGFDQAFGLLQPPRASTVKAKQGWMIAGSTMILNTTGVLGTDNQYLVAILTKQSAGLGYPAGRANVNKASSKVQEILAPATK
jgi:hypothetical protein